MKTINITIKLIIILLASVAIAADAQKLPKVQETSLRLPASVKIDGKAAEWKNNFQAYNNSTEVFYTIANDDEKLYLLIQATEPLVARKIMAGGIAFTMYPANNKNDKKAITFPLFDRKNLPNIDLKQVPVVTKTSIADSVDVYIFVDKINQELSAKSKEIGLVGIKGLDSTISVYNEQQIKAVAQFNDNVAYTYELAIPLKYLNLSINNPTPFGYNIRLNGSDHVEGAFIENIEGGIRITGAAVAMKDMRFFWSPTDFTGSYTLAKK
jgi:hypothetical protein